MKVNEIVHPDYDAMSSKWTKYRYTFAGGSDFINKYLKSLSTREETADFSTRKEISYCPAHAKSSIMEIKNAIFQRMVDITREGGSKTYQEAIRGNMRGVDRAGNNMNGYIGRLILPELLALGKIGVYIDRAEGIEDLTLADTVEKHPYLYRYQAEAIRAWSFDIENKLDSLLLQDTRDEKDEDTGLVVGTETVYRLLKKQDGVVTIKFYDAIGQPLIGEEYTLGISEIPFVIFEISQSLLTDVSDYQIALLNLASSDMSYALKSNYPFYTEQSSPLANPFIKSAMTGGVSGSEPGEASEADTAKPKEIIVGSTDGRSYPKGTERPGFIHPSPEPLRVSMEKQKELIQEIRQLVNLAVTNIVPTRASAESKKIDMGGLEAGLSYIGLELEYGERQIQEIWSMYEGTSDIATINYPERYDLRSDEDRRVEAEKDSEIMETIASPTFQKVMAKKIVRTMIGHQISNEEMDKINTEIDSAPFVVVRRKDYLEIDLENGLVSAATASRACGYPDGEVEIAQKEKAKRLAVIKESQESSDPASRGNPDESVDTQSATNEKIVSQDEDNNE